MGQTTPADEPTSVDPESREGRQRLMRLAYRFVWNRADAEDAVQNAFTLVHRKRSQLRDASKLWSWVCRIVVRQCLLIRSTQVRHERMRDAAAANDAHEEKRPSDRMESRERAGVLRWAIEQLPPQQRTAITLRHLEGMSYERVADIMEISRSTARVHVRAAREAIRVSILGRYGDYFQSNRVERSAQ